MLHNCEQYTYHNNHFGDFNNDTAKKKKHSHAYRIHKGYKLQQEL